MSQPENRDHGAESPAPARRLSPWWAIVPPVSLGTLAWLPFFYAWWRTRRRSFLTAAVVYGALLVIGALLEVGLGQPHPPAGERTAGALVVLVLGLGGFVHVLRIWGEYGRQMGAVAASGGRAAAQRDADLAPNPGAEGRRRSARVKGRVRGSIDFVYGAFAVTFFIVVVGVTLRGQASALGLVLVALSGLVGMRLLCRSRRQFVVAHQFDARSATVEMTRDPRPPRPPPALLQARPQCRSPGAALEPQRGGADGGGPAPPRTRGGDRNPR